MTAAVAWSGYISSFNCLRQNIWDILVTVPQTRIYLWLRFWLKHAKVWWQRTWIWWELINDKIRGNNQVVLCLNFWFTENSCKLRSQTAWVWCRTVASRGLVNPISTWGADCSHHSTTSPPGISDLATALWWKWRQWSRAKAVHQEKNSFSSLCKIFHKQGFTYHYSFNWKMLKFCGSRLESDGNLDKDHEWKQLY